MESDRSRRGLILGYGLALYREEVREAGRHQKVQIPKQREIEYGPKANKRPCASTM